MLYRYCVIMLVPHEQWFKNKAKQNVNIGESGWGFYYLFIDLILRDPFIMFNFRGSVLMFPVVTIFINRNVQAFLVSHLAHGIKILLGD